MRLAYLSLCTAVLAAACSSGGGGASPPVLQNFPPALQGRTFQAMGIGYDGTSQSATVTTSASAPNFRLTVDNVFDETLTLPPEGSTFIGTGAQRFTGSLSYATGVNSLVGTVSSSTGGATGSARAQFFGPSAEELGGTFNIPPTPSSSGLAGAFGMKR